MKNQKKIENWEKELDKKFRVFKYHLPCNSKFKSLYSEIKSFIRQLLKKEREEWWEKLGGAEGRNFQAGVKFGKEKYKSKLIEKIEKMEKPIEGFESEESDVGYNQALEDIKKMIEEI